MKEVNVGVIGFGTVGAGVVKILENDQKFLARRAGKPVVLKKVADLDITTDRGISLSKDKLTTDVNDILENQDINVVVEVIGGVNPAKSFISKALKNKKNVVTSNKEVIAKHGLEFVNLAKENGVSILYEAAVGGGIPILHAIRNSLSANDIQKVYGIVNGTTNYILTKMESTGADFSDILKEAQDLGYAEADPIADIDGFDVAYKLSIIASLAFRSHFKYKDIYFEGIRNITIADIKAAEEFGYRLKLLAIAVTHKDSVELRVHPVMIGKDHPLAAVNDAFNAVFVEGSNVGETMFYGRGAGEMPTASAIMGDVMDLGIRNEISFYSDVQYDFQKIRVMDMSDINSEYFLRMEVDDRAGVLALISKVFGDNNVSIKSVTQKDTSSAIADLIIVTHKVKEAFMQNAVKSIEKIKGVKKVCNLIRVGLE